jgi:phosphoglycerate kinase
VDRGPRTIELFEKEINGTSTILENGPMEIFENKQISTETFVIANLVTESNAISIMGAAEIPQKP